MSTIYEKMTAIGNAIRSKTGGTELLTLDDMASEIASISAGAELNFKVVGGTTQPTSPSEYTIWISTDVNITSWFFSLNNPHTAGEVNEGAVWISTEYNSTTKFNALRENGIHVYPSFAMQHIGGEWVTKALKLYQDGAWTSLWDGYLYNSGDECIDVTGGWDTAYQSGISSDLKGTLTKNADHLYLASDAYKEQVWAKTSNKINTRGHSTLEVTVNSFTSSSYGPTRKFGLSDGTSWDGDSNMIASADITSTGTFYLDLSAVPEGEYYICLFCLGVYSEYGVTSVRLT